MGWFNDITWMMAIREPYLTEIFSYFPLLVKSYVLITIVAVGFWNSENKAFWRDLTILVCLSVFLNFYLKQYFAHIRPPKEFFLIGMKLSSYSFPSGDAQIGMVFWYPLFRHLFGTKGKILGVSVVGLIALSRIYLGVHYPKDVLFGIAISCLVLYFYSKFNNSRLYQYLTANPLTASGLLAVLLAAYPLVIHTTTGWSLYAMAASMLIGINISGVIKGLTKIKFITPATIEQKIGLSLAGLVSVLFIYFSERSFQSENSYSISFISISYFIIALTIFFLVPYFYSWHQKLLDNPRKN